MIEAVCVPNLTVCVPNLTVCVPNLYCMCPQPDCLCPQSHCLCSQSDCLCPQPDCLCPQSHCLCSQSDCLSPICLCPQSDCLCSQSDCLCPQSDCLCPQSDCLCPQSHCLCPQSDCVPSLTVCLPNLIVCVPNLSVCVPNLTVCVPNLTVCVPNLTVCVPSLTVCVPSLTFCVPNLTVCVVFLTAACVPSGLSVLTLAVPERVQALEGSCVLIPCTFSQSQPPTRVELRLQYRWSTPMGPLFPTVPRTALSSQDGSRVHKDFQGRVALTGDTAKGDCAMTVTDVKPKDASNYVMEIRKLGELGWSRAPFRIDVTRSQEPPSLTDPGSVTDGQQVVLNCSATFPCPSQPPTLRWRWMRGRPDNSSVFGQPTVLQDPGKSPLLWASLTFTASYHLKPRIRCEVDYQGGTPVVATKDVHVKFPPKDVHIRLHTLAVREGGSALLECSCKADPPVEEYDWSYTQHGRTHSSPLHTLIIRVDNVTRHTRVKCTARNRLGWTASPFTAINVEYKPHILSSSSCEWDGDIVRCRCIVDSNPRAAITWSVNASLPPHGYNTSMSVHNNGTVTARLAGVTDAPPEVVCYANNAHGNDSHPLLQDKHGSLLWMTVAALCVAVSLLFIITVGLLCCCCCKQTGRRGTVINHHSQAVYPGDLAIYQEHTPLYINCTEVTHIYTNGSYQLVYQNCTPRFVRTKQTDKRRRRPGRRERATRDTDRPRPRERQRPRPAAASAESETPIYLEVL
ncbi:hypothetical protein ACEWY4_019595 [Coilia grayii]|uniref:Ig-like domain-containing protein n=1 Tax=Coilia grayii TaxID=363190 RepID=A0ABD1JAB4_9TELE